MYAFCAGLSSMRHWFRWRHAAVAITLLILLLASLDFRLSQFTHPYWEDEIHHNFEILEAGSLSELLSRIRFQCQPALDQVLRKWFWFPRFGHQEAGLRLPSLVYSMASVLVVFLCGYAYFRRLQAGIRARLFLSILPVIWIAAHSGEVQLSVEARHYSLVSLLSILWFSTYVLYGRVLSWSLFAATLAFANVHFFSLPLILCATFFEATMLLHERKFRPLSMLVASISVILVFTLAVNRLAFWELTLGAPLQPSALDFSGVLAGGIELVASFQSYLATPLPFYLSLAVLLAWIPTEPFGPNIRVSAVA